jgi:hypothetical protein
MLTECLSHVQHNLTSKQLKICYPKNIISQKEGEILIVHGCDEEICYIVYSLHKLNTK